MKLNINIINAKLKITETRINKTQQKFKTINIIKLKTLPK